MPGFGVEQAVQQVEAILTFRPAGLVPFDRVFNSSSRPPKALLAAVSAPKRDVPDRGPCTPQEKLRRDEIHVDRFPAQAQHVAHPHAGENGDPKCADGLRSLR